MFIGPRRHEWSYDSSPTKRAISVLPHPNYKREKPAHFPSPRDLVGQVGVGGVLMISLGQPQIRRDFSMFACYNKRARAGEWSREVEEGGAR